MDPQPERRIAVRSTEGRWLGGVCGGLAEHLGISVTSVRIGFVLASFVAGAGVLGYAACWLLMPEKGSMRRSWGARPLDLQGVLGLMSLGIGLLMALALLGLPIRLSVWVPFLMGVAGIVVLWRQSDEAGARSHVRGTAVAPPDLTRSHPAPTPPPGVAGAVAATPPVAAPGPQLSRPDVQRTGSAPDPGVIGRVLVGVLLLLVGVLSVVVPRQQLGTFAQAAAALLALLAGLVLIALPWIRAFGRRLQAEQLAAARAEERAAMAARVHDSVLQTLTLIQRRADDPAEVSRLARSEERALRSWLYAPAGPSGMLAAALAEIVADTEADYDVRIELVTVGDVRVDDRVAAMLAATREALVNAAKHAHGAATMVYVEVTDAEVEVNVRDRGPGFEPDAVDADRHGIRDSIIARMQSVGGSASVRSEPGEGAEVRLLLRLEEGHE